MRTLLVAGQKRDTYTVMALTVADKRATPVAAVESRLPPEAVYSPDGRWVAYDVSKAGGGVPSPDRGIVVQPFPPTGATYQVPKTVARANLRRSQASRSDNASSVAPGTRSSRLSSCHPQTSANASSRLVRHENMQVSAFPQELI